MNETDLQIKIVRLEERLIAAEKAVSLAAANLEKWEKSANNWREAINDERVQFVTRTELIAYISVAVAIVTVAFLLWKH